MIEIGICAAAKAMSKSWNGVHERIWQQCEGLDIEGC